MTNETFTKHTTQTAGSWQILTKGVTEYGVTESCFGVSLGKLDLGLNRVGFSLHGHGHDGAWVYLGLPVGLPGYL